MRILLISAKSDMVKGGIATWTKYYLSACEKNEISCDVVNTVVVGRRAVNATAKTSIIDEIKRTQNIFREEKRFLHSQAYDVAHLNTNIGSYGIIRDYFLAKRIAKRKIPLVIHFHCCVSDCARSRLIRRYIKKILSLSNIAFVLNSKDKDFLETEFSVESIPVANFVDEKTIVRSKDIGEKVNKIVFVGRVSKAKGCDVIVDLAKSFPDISFELIGEVSDEFLLVEKAPNISLWGKLSHDDVLRHMDEADIFLFPSRTEGFSLALSEAMARGLPVIAADVGANAEMVENQGGIIVPTGDIQKFREAIEKLFDADIREKMSEWNIEKVSKNYTTKRVFELFLKYYEDISGVQ